MDGLGNNLLANAVLALAYGLYKVVDRCLHSKCKYDAVDGFSFDADGGPEECAATDMAKIADLLRSRAALHHGRHQTTRSRSPPGRPPSAPPHCV